MFHFWKLLKPYSRQRILHQQLEGVKASQTSSLGSHTPKVQTETSNHNLED